LSGEEEKKKIRGRKKKREEEERGEIERETTGCDVRPPSPPRPTTISTSPLHLCNFLFEVDVSAEITRGMRLGHMKAWSLSFGSLGFAQNPVKCPMRSMTRSALGVHAIF
jgi:hypothetical protein